MAPEPIATFQTWLDDAVAAGLPEPTAMALATASADGVPANRMVLLKGVDDRGFAFFTNYESAKGRDLAANPRRRAGVPLAAARPPGARDRPGARNSSAAESDAYFATRPLGSQLGAHASPQSQVIADHGQLADTVAALAQRWAGQAVPRPRHWGGYRVRPETIEFWTHRDDRLHERIRYRRRRGGWAVERLAP